MAFGKYSRVDNNNRKSSGYCSSVTVVVFVGLCLVGIWMLTSSSNVSVGDEPALEKKTQLQDKVAPVTSDNSDSSNTSQFEENPGDLPDDATKGDTNVSMAENDGKGNLNTQENQDNTEESKSEESKKDDEQSASDGGEKSSDNDENSGGEGDSQENSDDKKSDSEESKEKPDSDENDKKSEESNEKFESDGNDDKSDSGDGENKQDESSSETNGDQGDGQVEKVDQNDNNELDKGSDEVKDGGQEKNQSSNDVFPSVAQSELLNETMTQTGSFSTQASESTAEKESQLSSKKYSWKVCNSTSGPDYIPCLDNLEAIRHLYSRKHYEHRERHCPEEPPTCLVPLPEGYKRPIEWPKSREKIWYHNVPHTKLAQIKGHQNWVKVSGKYLTFPGGGTQFKHGALHYIDFIEESVPDLAWGKQTRVILDVGCGVASFGGFLFDRNVVAMSFAPKDEHEAQVQFALERGIPAVSAVMGTKRLPYPGRVFDVVHCARCRVPWHIEGGKLLLELNRVLRPGGFFVWSATPIYQNKSEDVEIWEAMVELTKSMCWELVNKTSKDAVNGVAVAAFRKPTSNECYEQRTKQEPLLCPESDDPNAAWNVPLQACMHKAPVDSAERGSHWPEPWPERLEKSPYWLSSSQVGVYGKAAQEDFTADNEHWKRVVTKSYINGMGISWSSVRNVMDMNAVYGGFAAALKDMDLWVMNVVPIDSPDTLPIIYERGLFGMYHDWCESFSTYPRSYDLLHADHLFSKVKKRCNLVAVVAEVDRILRPEGKLIVRDNVEIVNELENMLKSMQWEVRMTYSKDKEGLLCVQKSMWRPKEVETIKYAIA
ncbi:putative methyltransferase PMT27 [Hibiscus syriacus]|uniref:Methyltransferase PMT27 n=1 Tax=Hibiscus syriacus TaxID=106335 RepID=A0A6A2YIP5_HIBSY|nr:probable methyltransferase PMT26 [Hibiscus syriacus]XP_039031011.1 probable methyltransferase PMT26 [Hibiscus syriacus]KAE8676547.1 putative methyltransferase PMT27 [Hibiscus syriacus]